MRKVAIYAYFPFWEQKQGADGVVAHQFEMFNDYEKTLIYYGKISKDIKVKISEQYDIKNILCINSLKVNAVRYLRKILSYLRLNNFYRLKRPFSFSKRLKNRVSKYLHKNEIDCVLLNYIWHADLFCTDKNNDIVKVIETHDSQYLFSTQFKKVNKNCTFEIKEEDEYNLLRKFDIVLAISTFDYKYFKKQLNNVIYLPPIVEPKYIEHNSDEVLKVGFIGGKAEFNYVAVKWFIDNVLNIYNGKLELHVFGGVCSHFEEVKDERVILHGFVKDVEEVYKVCNVMINPTFLAGGIKTKNLECMSYGIALMTTMEGSRGMEEGVDNGSIFASNNVDAWKEQLELFENSKYRIEFGKRGYDYVCKYFSKEHEDKFFEELNKKIK